MGTLRACIDSVANVVAGKQFSLVGQTYTVLLPVGYAYRLPRQDS